MSRNDPVYWDPFDREIARDPYTVYQRLRTETPLYYNDRHDFYALSRYEDIDRGLIDWRTFSSARGPILEVIKANIEIPPGTLLMEDPPAHDIHRKLLARVFTPRRVASLEPQIRDYCTRSLDRLAGAGGFDLMTEFANEVPMRVIGMLLGIPESDQLAVRERADAKLRTEPGQQMKVSKKALMDTDLFADYIDWRAGHPSDDLMTELLRAEFTDMHGVTRTLTREEILTYVTVLAGAGNETTARLIGWLATLLAEYPDQRAELVENPRLIPNAIEETLRFEPTGHALARYVTTDVELHGAAVPAGSVMMLLVASANRDERCWSEPDRFDVHRKISYLRTFGFGPHYCLGAALARLEAKVALEEFLNRFPRWNVDRDNAALSSTSTMRGWETLPITVG
ncbi:cytochrome P450 [Frankia sp. CNm7]|uniref:Cytochrome P450 n=1 Tax=Frankia nepalensis TaxID=1836974 RepID=A0A937RHD1_9ACTN|nr:cytochrome P450 [Frankia nepalensis]MBL7499023.1 cytochrome P450 [Frankia nepalensis]MBL7510165.1 cytochrome P450 [Frankia nepalensis]MBL7519316.1 cytochrome P450 [Frankia nepalensis]MBL7626051.1 cytochrome P450 [Frankia nepalensis]